MTDEYKYKGVIDGVMASTEAAVCCVIILEGNEGNCALTKAHAGVDGGQSASRELARCLRALAADIETHGLGWGRRLLGIPDEGAHE